MLDAMPAGTRESCFDKVNSLNKNQPHNDRWQPLLESAILILGSPRSGTTWLAKIFDSHPDILYRHEPDELTPPTAGLDPPEQLRAWLMQRASRVSAKRPYFQKSWRPAHLHQMRLMFAATLALAQRLPLLSRSAERAGIPDLVAPNRWVNVRAAMKLVNWDGCLAAKAMPNARLVFILRHPCGQIASVMAGHAARQLSRTSDFAASPDDLAAASVCAKRAGVDKSAFDKLPEAGKYAWCWRAFNEPAVAAMRDLPNARIVIYEDLCRAPAAVARDLLAFAGLDWHTQVDAFLGTSTNHDGPGGYYDVFRSTAVVADRWRQIMSPADQDAVRTVLATSSLVRCWPDLTLSAV
jgi:hypothetical protein